MTIIHLFRRYKRWNPVHPTHGAFWGLGVGVGCGVGWGPGFGPEVIGYVGAGCGLGFSVGVTFAGVGVGLPASGLTTLPLNALSFASTEMLNFTAKHAAPAVENASKQGWKALSLQAPGLKQKFNEAVFWSHERVRVANPFLWSRISFLAVDAAKYSWQSISDCTLGLKKRIQIKGALQAKWLDDVQKRLHGSSTVGASLSISLLK